MARRESQLVMRLIDGVSGPARKVGGSLKGLDTQTRRMAGRTQMLGGAAGAAGSAVRGLIAPAALAYGAGRAYNEFADVERRMTRIALTADAARGAQAAALAEVRRIAQETAQPVEGVVAGLEGLVAAGRSLPDAMAFLPAVARTAQASGAEVLDIATTADAIGTQFKIAGKDMQGAFDILVAGGKAGKFELKDMARYLPSLAPAAAAVGLKGEAGLRKMVAMAQVVRANTGTAEEAASSLQNIFAKMESEQTSKNFAKYGVNLRAEMAKARKEGKDLLTVFVELSKKATKGDLSKIPQLFTDMEFARGMRALLSAPGAVEKLVGELGKVDGSTMSDLNRVLEDSKSKVDNLSNSWGQFMGAVGRGLDSAGVTSQLETISKNLDATLEGIDARRKPVTPEDKTRDDEARRAGDERREKTLDFFFGPRQVARKRDYERFRLSEKQEITFTRKAPDVAERNKMILEGSDRIKQLEATIAKMQAGHFPELVQPQIASLQAEVDRLKHDVAVARTINRNTGTPEPVAEPPAAPPNQDWGGLQKQDLSAVGQQTGASFKSGLLQELQDAETQAAAIAGRIKANLAFTVSPTIAPKVQGAGASLRGIHADTGVGE